MNEIKLTQSDKKRIKNDIKLTSIIGLIFSAASIVFILIIPLTLYLLGIAAEGFARRSLFIIGVLSLPFIAVSWTNVFKYVDLRTGKKINLKVTDYDIKKTKDGLVLEAKVPLKLKLDLHADLLPLIKLTEPITIEITKMSKTLLFISHDTDNLIEKIETEGLREA